MEAAEAEASPVRLRENLYRALLLAQRTMAGWLVGCWLAGCHPKHTSPVVQWEGGSSQLGKALFSGEIPAGRFAREHIRAEPSRSAAPPFHFSQHTRRRRPLALHGGYNLAPDCTEKPATPFALLTEARLTASTVCNCNMVQERCSSGEQQRQLAYCK